MNTTLVRLADFLPQFLDGMAINFEIAALALVIGLALGTLLVFGRDAGGAVAAFSISLVGLMRAAPTFVVMFFLLNAIPRDASLFGVPLDFSGFMAVVLSLVPYSAAYVADNGVEALHHLRRGTPLGALLFLPSLTRAFFVLVMSSGAGAAIGVREGIAVILHKADQLPLLQDRLLLFGLGIVLFGIPLQAGFALVRVLQRRLGRIALARAKS
jgi:ABC-type arginine transport system permease subunit